MRKCPNCGTKLSNRDEFCAGCGLQLSSGHGEVPSGGNGNGSQSRILIAAALLVIVAVVAIVAAVFFASNPQKPLPTKALSSSAASATAQLLDESSAGSSSSGIKTLNYEQRKRDIKAIEDIAVAPIVMMPYSNESSSSRNGGGYDEESTHDILQEYYEVAGLLDEYVEEAAEDFNDNYLDPSREKRFECAEYAEGLMASIEEVMSGVVDLDLPEESKYYETWKDICTLYDCLWNRMDVIVRAWDLSLSFDKPKDHKDEILDPIREDVEDGNNKYYTKFKEIYQSIEL